MTKQEVYEKINELTDGCVYHKDWLDDDPPQIGIEGHFSAKLLREIAEIMEQLS